MVPYCMEAEVVCDDRWRDGKAMSVSQQTSIKFCQISFPR